MSRQLLLAVAAIASLMAIALAGYWSLGLMKPVIHTEAEVVVAKPPQEVFEAFIDPFSRMDWMEGFSGVERVAGDPLRPGSTARVFFERDGEKTELMQEMVAFERDALFEAAEESDRLRRHIRVTFTPSQEGGTVVRATCSSEGKTWRDRSGMAWGAKDAQARWGEDYLRLKKISEQGTLD